MIRSAPRLETERLILRSFEKSDLDAHAATLGNPDVVRFIGGTPLGREDSCRRMMSGAGCWPLLGFGIWAVESKADGQLVGHCGFFDYQRELEPAPFDLPEMGWIFDPSVHGKGIAFEACSEALAWADRHLDAEATWAMIVPGNEPSRQLALRLGYQQIADGNYREERCWLFRRLRPEASRTPPNR
ncbi:GNAT family N-acetyltransferase [Sphingomonas piscis]|uniref:GNAT family N-acetyltransferase n=1 Tax=Sphingomonas piscis TaxID=2714943 RepID=A0A6G7YLG4_9SPHN|nr:GNAT family N-acetyltransferase [Sphingomonas piscis]QIK77578.1 GNAT family N-acetyltransferase [Sphingomonas piscis]